MAPTLTDVCVYVILRADVVDSDHVDHKSRSMSRSFICPDCGLGVESIAAFTAHLLTHAQLSSVDEANSQPQSEHESLNNQPTTSTNHDADNTDHDDVMDVDKSVTDDLDTSTQGHCEGEDGEVKNGLETVVRLECPYCQRKDFDSVGPLTSHIRTAHARPSDNLFTCGRCGLAFATVDKLEQHESCDHGSTSNTTPTTSSSTSQDEPARWMCRFCPVQFYDSQTQRNHEESIHLSRSSVNNIITTSVVFCSQCSLGFPHIYALADHMHHSHGYNVRSRTDVQSPSPSSRSNTDLIRPTAVRPESAATVNSAIKCTECSTTFDDDDELECHVTSAHYLSLATEYGCTSCLKLFARPEDLQKHLMDIHAHHLYRCTLCKQVFDSKVCAFIRVYVSFLFFIFFIHSFY